MDQNTTSNSPSSAEIAAISAKIMIATVIIVFLLMLCLFCIHIYFRCFYSASYEDPHIVSWRRREARRSRNPPPATATRRRGLDPAALRSIPVAVFNPADFKDGLECAVCLSEVSEGEKARILPKCNHGFHVECIDMWFQSHSTCPLCRNPVENLASSNSNGVGVDSTRSITSSSSSSSSSSDDDDDDVHEVRVSEGSSSMTSGGELVIEIPMRTLMEEEEGKSPVVVTRLKSFKRLLSRGKRAVIPSPRASTSSGDVNEQV